MPSVDSTDPDCQPLELSGQAGDHAVCAACGSARITMLNITLTDGAAVHFNVCQTCGHSLWTSYGDGVGLADVLNHSPTIT